MSDESNEEHIGPGRPEHVPTDDFRKVAENSARIGLPQDKIAMLLGIGETTLKKHYADELKRGKAHGDQLVAGWAMESASKGNIPMRIFLAKVRLGWRETTHHELTGKDGAPIQPIIRFGTDERVDS